MVNYAKILTVVAVMGFAISFCISILSGIFPEASVDFDSVEYQTNADALEAFAGNLALEYSPYILMDVRSPGYSIIELPNPIPIIYPDGDEVGRDRYHEGSPYGNIGVTNADGVYLDPEQKSSQRLGNTILGEWTHTGYRYVFGPSVDATDDEQINLIWYKFGEETGLDAGVDVSVLDKRFSYLPATDIILNYDVSNQIGEYKLTLGDRSVYVILKFNETALQENGGDYYETWDEGGWSINIAKKILSDSVDVSTELIDAVLGILQMNNPNLPGELNILLWLIVTVPALAATALYIVEFLPFW